MNPAINRNRERGSATIIGIALMLVALMMGWAVIALGELATARARVSSAADLAALAAAAHSLTAGECEAAARIAEEGRSRLLTCTRDGEDVVVTVAGEAPGVIRKLASAAGADPPLIQVQARAGPQRALPVPSDPSGMPE